MEWLHPLAQRFGEVLELCTRGGGKEHFLLVGISRLLLPTWLYLVLTTTSEVDKNYHLHPTGEKNGVTEVK